MHTRNANLISRFDNKKCAYSRYILVFSFCAGTLQGRGTPYPGTHSPISYALPPLPIKQPATSPPAASIPHRKTATRKQPAPPPHPTARSQAKEGPYAVPQPIRTHYRLQNGGERERWLV